MNLGIKKYLLALEVFPMTKPMRTVHKVRRIPAKERSGSIEQPPTSITYYYVVTDDEDAYVEYMFLVHKPFYYEEVTKQDDLDVWKPSMVE